MEQQNLFTDTEDGDEIWKKEWQNMPEFKQEDLTPELSVIVHFKNKEDRDAFAALIGQKITYLTQSLWYPKAEIGRYMDKLFINEEPENEDL